ncbi:AbrB family transcriptional regulator [Gallaecimonas mangrovi]|uniref:AbrB family transcriptional regulator n=1 Tax=Gallaecimonas mangrovi TaxID=2291597 RepID=UPI0012603813|nr:AbrB family transcriptional regulator [Gallaecimonas mangrovi]
MYSALPKVRLWAMLLLFSALFFVPLNLLHLPAALLLGPMMGGIVMGVRGHKLTIPRPIYSIAQSLIGLMVAAAISMNLLHSLLADAWLYIGIIVGVLAVSSTLGWMLCKGPWLPGTTGLWGIYPGAASAMVMMAENTNDADVRLVALMQYLRVLLVAVTASMVAHLATGIGHVPVVHHHTAFNWQGLSITVAMALGFAFLGRVSRIPSGPLMLAMIIGAAIHLTVGYKPTLPHWLLAMAYATLGWHVGLGFTSQTLKTARRALVPILLSIVFLMSLCAGIGYILVRFLGIDPLTAYLATSPGGMDAVAIIAAGSNVDLPFVMAMQTLRFLLVLMFGPSLARYLAGHFAKRHLAE